MTLRVEGLTKTYANGVRALAGIELNIQPGLFGLLGPNGAGKSTLMRTIATLQEPDSGNIYLSDHDVLADGHYLRQRLGYLPQDFGVYPKVSAPELLNHLAVLKGISDAKQRRETVDALLQLTNLHHTGKRHLSTFSGGMKRRFGIAQALLGDPELVIVDEPTAGLDPEERERFHNLLCEIGTDVVVILSTHIVSDVRDLCDQLAIINEGHLLLTGAPETLTDQLQGLVWEAAVDRETLEQIQAQEKVLSTKRTTRHTRVRVFASHQPDDIFRAATPNLEDVYFGAIRGFHAAEVTV